MILHLAQLLGANQLQAGLPGAVELHLHVAPADDLALAVFERKFHAYINCMEGVMHTGQRDVIALEGGGEGHGDVNLGDLDLDVPGLQGGGVEFGVGGIIDQCVEQGMKLGFNVRNVALGHDLSSVAHVVSVALRAAFIFGSVQAGDYEAMWRYTMDRVFAAPMMTATPGMSRVTRGTPSSRT